MFHNLQRGPDPRATAQMALLDWKCLYYFSLTVQTCWHTKIILSLHCLLLQLRPLLTTMTAVCFCLVNMLNIDAETTTAISFMFDKSHWSAKLLYLQILLPVFHLFWQSSHILHIRAGKHTKWILLLFCSNDKRNIWCRSALCTLPSMGVFLYTQTFSRSCINKTGEVYRFFTIRDCLATQHIWKNYCICGCESQLLSKTPIWLYDNLS